MTVAQVHETHDAQTFNYRWTLEAGDTLIVNFNDHTAARRLSEILSYFYIGVAWRVKPASGATVAVSVHFDGDYKANADWDAHGKHDSITETTGFVEDAPLGALRFVASSAGATISMRSPQQVGWEEG